MSMEEIRIAMSFGLQCSYCMGRSLTAGSPPRRRLFEEGGEDVGTSVAERTGSTCGSGAGGSCGIGLLGVLRLVPVTRRFEIAVVAEDCNAGEPLAGSFVDGFPRCCDEGDSFSANAPVITYSS